MLKKNLELSKGQLAPLSSFLDENDIIRVGGRLGNSKYDKDKKYPILLPGDHMFTRCLFSEEHNRLLHTGPQSLLASIREQF